MKITDINGAKAAILSALREWHRRDMLMKSKEEIMRWAEGFLNDRADVFVPEKTTDRQLAAIALVNLCIGQPSHFDKITQA